MTVDTIYVPLGGAPGDAVALKAARAFAPVYDADVTATFVGPDLSSAVLIGGDGVTGLGAPAIEALREERARAETAARETAAAHGVSMSVADGPRTSMTAPARLAALAVLDPEAALGRGPLVDMFETLLLEDGVPVLISRGASEVAIASVAWDGSREAVRALKAAAPLLAQARAVRIVQSPATLDFKDVPCADPDRARTWIARHGGPASVETVTVADHGPAELVAALKAGGVDLVIAGAYGHARLREAVFGGMTRALLHDEGPSLLLAH